MGTPSERHRAEQPTTVTGPSPTTASDEQVSRVGAGARAGIAISAIVGTLILAAIAIFLFRHRNRWRAAKASQQRMQELHVPQIPMSRTAVQGVGAGTGGGLTGPMPGAQIDDMKIELEGNNSRV